jgi:hypothetical protein
MMMKQLIILLLRLEDFSMMIDHDGHDEDDIDEVK